MVTRLVLTWSLGAADALIECGGKERSGEEEKRNVVSKTPLPDPDGAWGESQYFLYTQHHPASRIVRREVKRLQEMWRVFMSSLFSIASFKKQEQPAKVSNFCIL